MLRGLSNAKISESSQVSWVRPQCKAPYQPGDETALAEAPLRTKVLSASSRCRAFWRRLRIRHASGLMLHGHFALRQASNSSLACNQAVKVSPTSGQPARASSSSVTAPVCRQRETASRMTMSIRFVSRCAGLEIPPGVAGCLTNRDTRPGTTAQATCAACMTPQAPSPAPPNSVGNGNRFRLSLRNKSLAQLPVNASVP